jgi:ubiquinone biosynthesis protein
MRTLRRFIQITKVSLEIKHLFTANKNGEVNYAKIGPVLNKKLSELGPTFIKLGQMLSMRADMIPSPLADQFRSLLDHGPVEDFEKIQDLFISEVGKTPAEVFDSFSVEPIAVASISQVHVATYKGRKLAVKIQKPHIKSLILQDLKICRTLLKIVLLFSYKKSSKVMIQTAMDAVGEFFTWIERELDYRLEALNLARIKEHFSKDKTFLAPDVLHEFSGRRVLTMTYIEGVSLNELFTELPDLPELAVIKYKNIKMSKKTFIDRALKIIFKQFFVDGYFHADPHPANIIITPLGQIAFIDFGVVGILHLELKKHVVEVVAGIVDKDAKKILQGLLAVNEGKNPDSLDPLEKRIEGLMHKWESGSVLEMSMAEVFYELLTIAQDNNIRIPLTMFIVGKTLLEYDGVLTKFDPELDIVSRLKPLVEKSVSKDMGFLQKIIPTTISDWASSVKELPLELEKLIKTVTEEGIDVSVHFGPGSAKKS